MAKKTNYITRRVIEGKEVDIYGNINGQMTLLGTEKVKKVDNEELAKKYNVDKVIVDVKRELKAVYGVPVEEYMKLAKFLYYKDEKDKADNTTDKADKAAK